MTVHHVVFDASTLILLAKTDLLQIWLSHVNTEIPEAVKKEALAKPGAYDAQLIGRLIKEGKIDVCKERGSDLAGQIERQFRIGKGEAAALALAKEKKCALAVDDGVAIKAAKILGVPFLTALHVLVGLCDQKKIKIKSAVAKLDLLETFGRYEVSLVADARSRIEKGR